MCPGIVHRRERLAAGTVRNRALRKDQTGGLQPAIYLGERIHHPQKGARHGTVCTKYYRSTNRTVSAMMPEKRRKPERIAA